MRASRRAVRRADRLHLVELRARGGAGQSRCGPRVRNCEELSIRNGFTPPTHGVGSSIGCPVSGSMQRPPVPGAVFGTHCDGPNRPSPWRAAIIASAAAFPASMPCALNGPSGIAAERARTACSEVLQQPPGPGRDASRARSTRCSRARGSRGRRRRPPSRPRAETPRQQIRPVMLRPDRVDRVVDGALDHRHVDLGRRRCPARGPGSPMSVLTAISFQSSTMSGPASGPGSGAAYDVGPTARIISAMPSMTSSERILVDGSPAASGGTLGPATRWLIGRPGPGG